MGVGGDVRLLCSKTELRQILMRGKNKFLQNSNASCFSSFHNAALKLTVHSPQSTVHSRRYISKPTLRCPIIVTNNKRGPQWGCSKHGTRLKISRFHGTRLNKYIKKLFKATNNTVIWTKIIHDTRLIFWTFHATLLTPLRPS